MTLNKPMRLAAWLAASLLITSTAAASVVWNEQAPGAGSLVSTAQVTFDSALNPLSQINGALNSLFPVNSNPFYEVDLYQIRIYDFAAFSASTTSGNPQDDTSLFLFNSAGLGVYMNDDNGTDLFSLLPAGNANGPLANDIFYLAVSLGGYEAYDSTTAAIFAPGSFTNVRGSAGAGMLNSWVSLFGAGTESAYSYTINLTGASVAQIPEPATIALALFALAGVAASRRSARAVRC